MSLMAHRDQALLIFRPDGELFDRPLFAASSVRGVNESDKSRRRSSEAADWPSGDSPPLTLFTLTLTHEPKYRTTRRRIRWRRPATGVP